MKRQWRSVPIGVVVAAMTLAAACGGGERPAAKESAAAAPPSGGAPGGPLTPGEGGQVIKVEMMTDEQGNNKFVPATFEARTGDVIRYTLVSGVHNVHFLADSNPGLKPMEPSPLLQVPGQTFDVAVDFPPGSWYFQCDPHALLGMVGRVTVKARQE